MDESIKRLTRELWDLIVSDGGECVRSLLAIKSREGRRGKTKRLICKAIDGSSLGVFGGRMYYFGGRVYVPIDRSTFHRVLYDILANRINVPDGDLVKLSDLYMDSCNVVYSKPLQVSNNVMVFHNGVLDVEQGVFSKTFDKRFVQMWSVDYDYTPMAKTFLWHQFINQVLPDKYWQDALQMFLGATFIDRKKVKIEHIMILLGKGSNGKSVIQQAVCGVLGEEYVSQHEIGRLCSRGNDGDMAVAEINGKRLNYCTEMEETDFYKKSARLKAIVSGENVTARQLYGNPFKATNIPLLMANANRLPIFNQKDDALLRRIYVIPFNVVIAEEKQNRTLGDELVSEYPAILNWILEGRDKFIKNGYRLPNDIKVSTMIKNERVSYNSALTFMKKQNYKPRLEGVTLADDVQMTLSDLYARYSRWCLANEISVMGKTVFSTTLENNGFRRERKSFGVIFHVFCDTVAKLERQRKKQEKEKEVGLVWYNGKAYAQTIKQLMAVIGVSRHVIIKMKGQGKMDNLIKGYKNHLFYDVQGCYDFFKSLHVIASDDERKYHKRLDNEHKKARDRFNARMAGRGWPYRKYATGFQQIEEGLVVVPDDTTEREVIEMAQLAGYDVSHLYSSLVIKREEENINQLKEIYGTEKSDEVPSVRKVHDGGEEESV